MKYKCGWWTWELLLVTGIEEDDGYTFEEILEQYYPIKAQLFDFDKKDITRAIKNFNKNNKHIKYEFNDDNLVERL